MDDKLKDAVSLYNKGNKPQAAKLLGEIVQQTPNNSVAWYGLALCLDELDKKIYCLKKVVSLDPSHKKAQQLLDNLQTKKNLPSVDIRTKEENPNRPPKQKSASKNFIKDALDELTSMEKKALFALIGLAVLVIIGGSIEGINI